jgi:hypothetical protein
MRLDLPPAFRVRYEALANELYIGGVYVRIFLKQPTFELSNPVFFLEKLIEQWERSFEEQVPKDYATGDQKQLNEDDQAANSRSLIVATEDFLSIMNSCLLCLLRTRHALIDNFASWGVLHRLVAYMRRALDRRLRGTPLQSTFWLVHLAMEREACISNLSTISEELMVNFVDMLKPELPRDATLVLEALKRLIEASGELGDIFTRVSIENGIHSVLVSSIIDDASLTEERVENLSALRVHAIDILKHLASHITLGY